MKEKNNELDLDSLFDNLDDEPIEKSAEAIEFEKYSKLFEERFGEKAYIAEPGGTYEQTINAIKKCLELNENILDSLLYDIDILGLMSFRAKKIDDYEDLERILLKAVIYYIIAIEDKEMFNIDVAFRILSYERNFLRNCIEKIPQDHPAYINLKKLEFLNDRDYNYIASNVRERIAEITSIFKNKSLYNFEKLFNAEDDVEKYVNEIIRDRMKDVLF